MRSSCFPTVWGSAETLEDDDGDEDDVQREGRVTAGGDGEVRRIFWGAGGAWGVAG